MANSKAMFESRLPIISIDSGLGDELNGQERVDSSF
jgi:hypothetical protein